MIHQSAKSRSKKVIASLPATLATGEVVYPGAWVLLVRGAYKGRAGIYRGRRKSCERPLVVKVDPLLMLHCRANELRPWHAPGNSPAVSGSAKR